MNHLSQYLPDLQPVGWLGVVLTFCGVAGYGFKAIRFLVRLLRKTSDFLDDWQGEPARPGVAARRGVVERISDLETTQAHINAQMNTNGGLSLRDQTNRIEKTLNEHILASKAVPH